MSKRTTPALERLAAADPGRAVTEDDLARSREKSLAVMHTDAVQLAVGGAVERFHRQPPTRRRRVFAAVGLVAAAAAVVAGVFAASLSSQQVQQPVPAATQPDVAQDSSSNQPLPEITGRMPTFDAEIVTGGNGNKAAVAKDEQADFHMDALNVGKLGLNSGQCMSGVYPDGTSLGLIFPRGTQVTGTGVVLPDGTSISLGQEFSFGGGLSPEGTDVGVCSSGGSPFLVQDWDVLP
ncbi:hypothetical protein [Paenarthrobacter nitroguajacolicus]|uniref:hypothetical protein n=1 Tax=Paenarthrobacter nitroguajacolicus TaxID=211146 RepID=UPI00248D2AAB|nr:hypothetical protein [Paenarthrobacter nitroguajacolicus]MDI2033772.1 hypothetical protein [Paenarthrobacter nitroguajacolicus]